MAARLLASTAGSTARSTHFNSRAEICTLCSQTYSFSTTSHFWLYLPNAEITLDLEVNEVEVKVLTSLASVVEITAWPKYWRNSGFEEWRVKTVFYTGLDSKPHLACPLIEGVIPDNRIR